MQTSLSIKSKALKTALLTTLAFASLALVIFAVVTAIKPSENVSAARASDFKPGRIIDDAVFYNANAMNASQIQAFLNSKVPHCDTNGSQPATDWGRSDITRATLASYIRNGSHGYTKNTSFHAPPYTCLKDFKQNTPQVEAASGLGCSAMPARNNRTAAQIINDVSKACGINPQVLLVLLNKEQSLVTDIWPLNLQYERATGFACPDNAGGACDPSYNGFFRQVYSAARQFKTYQAYPNSYNYVTGRTNNILWQVAPPDVDSFLNSSGSPSNARSGHCGHSRVLIENQATAGLYIYTPYRPNQASLNSYPSTGDDCSAYGNRNFWFMFTNWFGSTSRNTPSNLIECSGEYYLVEHSQSRKRLLSSEALEAWSITEPGRYAGNEADCLKSTFGLGADNIIESRNTGRIYFVDRGTAYLVNNQSAASAWGISLSSTYPKFDGDTIHQWLQVSRSGMPRVVTSTNESRADIYIIDNGTRYPLGGSDGDIETSRRLVVGYDTIPTETISTPVLRQLNVGEPIDYAFMVGSDLYLMNHNELKKVDPSSKKTWLHIVGSVPKLSNQVLNLFKNTTPINEGFYRSGHYYKVSSDGDIERTDSSRVAANWLNGKPSPLITRMLTNEILGSSPVSKTVAGHPVNNNIRLIECSGDNYLIERNRRVKRIITDTGMKAWEFNGVYFDKNDRGCDYSTYDAQLESLIRSRNTGKVYLVEKGIAYYVHSQSAADKRDLGSVSETTYPQFDPASIHDNLTVIRTLPDPAN